MSLAEPRAVTPPYAARHALKAVLFDLDGTLIDSAPDLAGAANWLRQAHGLEALPYEVLRPMVGAGARGMVGAAFGVKPGHPRFEALRDQFLARYAEVLLDSTSLFDDMAPLLQALEASRLPWGVVTNKATRFTEPVLRGLGLDRRAAVVICGDTTAHAKPHPEPLFEAARRLGFAPDACAYVGDDARDIAAGRAAGMLTMAATWGYLGQGSAVDQWGADAVLNSPAELLNLLGLA